ncbi:MAG: hypothetical protein ACXADY_01950 [Candidatus Hodarchaeales archaeon]
MIDLETGFFLLFILLLATIHTLSEVMYKSGSTTFVHRIILFKEKSKLSIVLFPLSIIVISIGISLGVKVIYGIILGSNPLSITSGLFLGSIAIFSVFFGKIFFHEQVSPRQVGGVILIALGIIFLV